jgi:hypothetical protein
MLADSGLRVYVCIWYGRNILFFTMVLHFINIIVTCIMFQMRLWGFGLNAEKALQSNHGACSALSQPGMIGKR